jgi:hypothetical protein
MGIVFWELVEGRGALPWGSSDIFKIRDWGVKELKRPPIPDATPQVLQCSRHRKTGIWKHSSGKEGNVCFNKHKSIQGF